MDTKAIEELRARYEDLKRRNYRSISISGPELESLVSFALGVDSASVEVETSTDYSCCYYEGDEPTVVVDSFTVRTN